MKTGTFSPINRVPRIPLRHQAVPMESITNTKEEPKIATSVEVAPRIWDKKLHKHKRAKQRKGDGVRENVISRQDTVQKERVLSFHYARS